MRMSVAIIEYHCMDDVQECVRSVRKHLKDLDHDFIVITNSCYGASELIQYKEILGNGVNLLSPNKNLGYAGGVNLALQECRSDYLYVLNPDCRIMDDNIVHLMLEMDEDPRWAISGPMVVDNDNEVQPSCRRFPKPWTFLMVRSFLSRFPVASRERARYLMEDCEKVGRSFVDWVSGGATLVKMRAVEEIGGMDERYFLYMEDVDWCRSAWEKNYKVAYWPHSCVQHAGQHRSIRAGLLFFVDRHVRWHLTSLLKYLIKYHFSVYPESKVYRDVVTQR